jgi:hypothetical protein
VAQLIAEKNVGGLVASYATVIGTPPDVRTTNGADAGHGAVVALYPPH